MSYAALVRAMSSAGATLEAIEAAVAAVDGGRRPKPSRKARPSSKWRKLAFQRIAARDGLSCGECREPHRVLWRAMGAFSTGLVDNGPWTSARYTKVHPTSNLELDHRKPLSEGGGNEDANLWLLCTTCHKAKSGGERSWRLRRALAEAQA